MKIQLDSKIIGKSILHFAELSSTNDYAYDLLSNNNPIEGTAIIADYQSCGKGQYGRKWNSEPSANVLTSIILRPTVVTADRLHLMNVMLSLAVVKLLTYYKIEDIQIKWPNDILVDGQKIAGLLIQNILQGDRVKGSVLGLGLNVNQEDFDHYERPATSIRRIIGIKINRAELYSQLYACLDVIYMDVLAQRYQLLIDRYNEHLGPNQSYVHIPSQCIITLTGLQIDGQLSARLQNGDGCLASPDDIEKLSPQK